MTTLPGMPPPIAQPRKVRVREHERRAPDVTEQPRARRTDPGTSHAAAASVTDLPLKQRAVYETLKRQGPQTDQGIAMAYPALYPDLPQSPSGLRTRRRELVDAGFVFDTGKRMPLRSGRHAIIWAPRG